MQSNRTFTAYLFPGRYVLYSRICIFSCIYYLQWNGLRCCFLTEDSLCIAMVSLFFCLWNCFSETLMSYLNLYRKLVQQNLTSNVFDNLTKARINITSYCELNILSNVMSTCFRKTASPLLISSTSIIFSINIAALIVFRNQILYCQQLQFLILIIPVFILNTGLVITFAPAICAAVNTMSENLKLRRKVGLGICNKIPWIRKKYTSLQLIRIGIGDCFFDKQMALKTADNTISNAITILLVMQNYV